MDELREAVRARDTFLTLAAHELRTPLTSAQLKLDRLRRLVQRAPGAVERPELEASLTFVARHQRRLAALVDNVMEVAAITAGGRSLARRPVRLAHAVADVAAKLDDELRASGSTLSVEEQSEVTGCWDRARVVTIVRNLLSNAIKYGGGKPIEVTVAADAGCARLVVTDHGVGIPEAEQARIFNKFEHAIPEHHFGGFGLGLWLVRRLVEEHGGSIEVRSREGDRTTFVVHLPLAVGGQS